ncbi:MAG TPA: DUF2786 domain-containing protein [Mycobacteriales bacterium]|nr:DUF2786 domain-containing protein [Mycobacteriales bacterium]
MPSRSPANTPDLDRSDRVIDKIGKLLAQAEGTGNEHEAEAFVSRAQELATAYAVDLELARSRQAARRLRAGEEEFEQRRLAIGDRGRRGNRHLVTLYLVVAQANDVMVNVANDSTFVLGFGYAADLDVVERLWASLATQMATAAGRRLRAGEHRAARVAAVTWRLSFYEGWLHAVQTRLDQARERALATHDRDGGATSSALVLRAKAERVRAFHDRESEARGSWRGQRADRQVHRGAWRAGEQEGRLARLGEPEVGRRRALG